MKDLILIPKLNIEEDEQAFAQIQMYYSEYAGKNRIISVDMRETVKGDGALNCISWTIKSNQ